MLAQQTDQITLHDNSSPARIHWTGVALKDLHVSTDAAEGDTSA